MFNKLSKNDIQVLYEFSNLDIKGYDYFYLDNKELAIYLDEKEIILRDGL